MCNQWIAVSERLPEMDVTVIGLCVYGRKREVCSVVFVEDHWRQPMMDSHSERVDVTHWQLLPLPPKGD